MGVCHGDQLLSPGAEDSGQGALSAPNPHPYMRLCPGESSEPTFVMLVAITHSVGHLSKRGSGANNFIM